MKKTFIFLFGISVLFAWSYTTAQNEGAINPDLLNNIRLEFNKDSNVKAIMNAVSSNDIQKLALSRENLGEGDTYFSYRVKTNGITDQKSTGRCWLFTGLNVIRAHVINKYNLDEFSFSHNYNFFYDQLEKANLFYEGIITTAGKPIDDKKVEWFFKNPIGDGGQWTGVIDIINKYGLVPSDVFPESYSSENTSRMSRLLRTKLKKDALEMRKMYADGIGVADIRKEKEKMLAEVYRILAITLGEPPTEFDWRYKDKDDNVSELKKYTPQSFYKDFVGINLEDYVMFMNDPTREFDKLYEIDYDRHVYDGHNWKYLNLKTDKIKEFAKKSIMDGEGMYFSCDVGKQLDKNNGTLNVNNYNYNDLFGVDFDMNNVYKLMNLEGFTDFYYKS
jgi:bleomycin hydrolase